MAKTKALSEKLTPEETFSAELEAFADELAIQHAYLTMQADAQQLQDEEREIFFLQQGMLIGRGAATLN